MESRPTIWTVKTRTRNKGHDNTRNGYAPKTVKSKFGEIGPGPGFECRNQAFQHGHRLFEEMIGPNHEGQVEGPFQISITWPRRRPYNHVLQFKITLLETDPPVWRRIRVPDYYTFYDVHVAIQDAMGWEGRHLHDFKIRPLKRASLDIRIESPFAIDDLEDAAPILTTEVAGADFIQEPGDRALYTYDYGDDWLHDVLFEGSCPKEPGKKYLICLAGELAGPPEDCGGIPGYYDCVKAVKERDNSEDRLTWLGRWKPDRFDPEKIKFWSPLTRLKMALKD